MLDASAAVLGLLSDGPARQTMAREAVAIPHLTDVEVAHALRAQVLREAVTASEAADALSAWADLGLRRYPVVSLLPRVWELRHNLSAYDASYVALAEALGCAVVTADVRLAGAPGPRCAITTVR